MPFFVQGNRSLPNRSFDPSQLPVDAIAGEPALDAERLDGEWLRQRFAAPPDWQPEQPELALFARGPTMTAASVLIPLVQRAHGLSMLLTMRTAHLTDHAGQISFPGGRAEDDDASA